MSGAPLDKLHRRRSLVLLGDRLVLHALVAEDGAARRVQRRALVHPVDVEEQRRRLQAEAAAEQRRRRVHRRRPGRRLRQVAGEAGGEGQPLLSRHQ